MVVAAADPDRTEKIYLDQHRFWRRPVPATHDELDLIDAYSRAGNYLWVGQIYVRDNPLLHEPHLGAWRPTRCALNR